MAQVAQDDHLALEVRRIAKRGTQKVRCPACHHTHSKHNKGAKDMVITMDEERILYFCHRCCETGRINLVDNIIRMERRIEPEKKREERDSAALPALTDEHLDWLKERGVSKATAEEFKLFASNQFNGTTAIGFPYFSDKGRVNAVKSRTIVDKKFLCWQAPISFFGIERIKLGDDLVIVEGEMDALAMAEAGINAIAVPNGAPAKLSEEGRLTPEEDTKFRYLWNAKPYIDKAKRIVLAVDMDAPGNALAEEIARRVGKARCWRVKWEGGKDANDILLVQGRDAIRQAVKAAEPWPVEGLYDAAHFGQNVLDLYHKGLGRGASTGYANVDDLYTVVEGQVCIVTGIPSSGKSEFIDQLMVNMASALKWKFAVCSFENEPRLHIAKLISKKMQLPFFDGYLNRRMSETEMKAGLEWVNENFVFVHQENGDLSDLDSIIDRLRAAVLRFGIRGAVIDPYNFISRPRDVSETEWISAMLTRVKVFAMSHGVHIWFVAHPQKLQKGADGKIPVPGGYDISGCYDDKTEVLTSEGWVPHPLVTAQHHVAAFDIHSGTIRYERPQAIHAYDYTGAMHHWNGAALDIMVTPNHRMVAKRSPLEVYGFTESQDITPGRWYFPSASGAGWKAPTTSAIDVDLGYDTLDLMWFIGFWVAEGCVQANSLSVCQAVDQHHVPKSIMDRLGFVYSDAISNGRHREKQIWVARLHRRWHIDLIDMVVEHCREGAANKRVPPFLFAMDRSAKLAFLEGYWFGDGSTKNNSREACTISKGLADDIQRLAVECGFYTSMRADYTKNECWADRYVVTWREQSYRSVQVDRNLSVVDYSGVVYCLTMSTGAYVTRRNGRVAYQGNSAAWFAKADVGLTIHRDTKEDPFLTQVHLWKVRFSWVGKQGETRLRYDPSISTYYVSDEEAPAIPQRADFL